MCVWKLGNIFSLYGSIIVDGLMSVIHGSNKYEPCSIVEFILEMHGDWISGET